MSERTPTGARNLDSNHYGLATLEWSRIRDHLVADMPRPETAAFLATVGPDGRPHAAGIGPAWHDGDAYFTSSPGTRKARHLETNPNVTLAMRLEGIDVVLEGTAARITDRATLEALLAKYVAGGWPAEMNESRDAYTAPFSAPSAGPPPWNLYRLNYHTVYAVAYVEPYGATRWTFTD